MEARYEERIRACKTDDELAEYLLSCVPVIKEYTSGASQGNETMTKVAGLRVSTKKGVQRNDIYKKYLQEVEKDVHVPGVIEPFLLTPCSSCGRKEAWYIDEAAGDAVCISCGNAERWQDEVAGHGFKEQQEMEMHTIYAYKRENHFNEWISQFQAKESTTVPEEVIGKLRTEFRKQKVKDLAEITHEKVKALLKKLGYAKYYEHVPYIATIVSGITPPTMPQALEDKLRLMFHAIQTPFEKHKPANRKNFLSYSYVLFKLCELLGEDEYLKCFPLLKSREKLYIQDQIWKKICDELSWEFIKTL